MIMNHCKFGSTLFPVKSEQSFRNISDLFRALKARLKLKRRRIFG